MTFPAFRTHVTSLLTAGSLAAAAVSLTGCGALGPSYDVKMEVAGPGGANVVYSFSGDNNGKTASVQKLPWTRAQNVGFGFNRVSVSDPEPGTSCRIYVDDKLKDEEKKPDAKGYLSCSVSLKG
ncbi:MmpS family transport accessory protein [Streptomyces sp. NPDC001393]